MAKDTNYQTVWRNTPPPQRLAILPKDEQLAAGAQWHEMDAVLQEKVKANIDELDID